MALASATLPGRILYIQRPVSSAAGIVRRIVNIPHEDSARALTTTIATLAIVHTMMNMVATLVVTPATRPMLSRAMRGRLSPPWRTLARRITKSCAPPARHAPMTIHESPGR